MRPDQICLAIGSHSLIHQVICSQTAIHLHGGAYQLWPALPKPATHAHYGKEQFSLLMDSSINKLTNYRYTSARSWQVCFCWGLFLRPVRYPWVLGCWLNATGWLVQAAILLEITTRLVYDIGHGFGYECNEASLWAISPWKLLNSAVTTTLWLPTTLHPLPLYKCLWYWYKTI